MGLHKPTNIPKLEEILSEETSPENEIRQILESVDEFGTEKADKNTLQYLAQTESHYPIIPVQGKCLLLAVISKSFKGLVWLSNWFEVQYSRTNKNNEPVKQYRVSCDCQTVKTINEKYLDDMIIYGLRECIFSPVNTDELLQKLNEYGKAQNEEIDLQIRLLQAEKADIDKRCKNLIAVIEKGNSIDSIVEQIKEMEEQIDKINSRISQYEASKKTFTLDDLKFIKDKFTDYVREECNEDVIIFLNDTIDKIQVDDVIDVKLKKNIKVDHNTKKIFG